MTEFIKAMISSTFIDLTEHRQQAILACLQERVFPLAMETLPAINMTALEVSLQMVSEADIYIGIFGYRYGSIPEGDDISITHQEYLQACRRDIPRLIFRINEQHPLTIRMVDVGNRSRELEELIQLIQNDRVVAYFNSPEDLRGKIAASIRHHRETSLGKKPKYLPHRVERYDSDDLLGRKNSLASLNRWVVDARSEEYTASIYIIVASSGMGKSLLAWKWFDSITDKLWKRTMWWSLYQKADFEVFLKLALINLVDRGEQEISDLNTEEKTTILLDALRRESFLIVLDGLEHALANGESNSIAIDRHTVDAPIEVFLRRFRNLDISASRILITTTSIPQTLVRDNGEARERVYKHELSRLTSNEALELWRGLGLTIPRNDARKKLLSLMENFYYHPLFIRALAGEVRQDIQSGGNFQTWWHLNRINCFAGFRFGGSRVVSDWMSRLLNNRLGNESRETLLTISAFYCPCRYNVLSTLMSERGFDEQTLSNSLHDLEARGLINRIYEDEDNRPEPPETHSYRIHQLIIEAGWEQQDTNLQVEIATQLFNILIMHRYYNDAYEIFIGRLNRITFAREYNLLRVELLEQLFTQGIDKYPALTDKDRNIEHDKKAIAMASLVRGYLISGQLYRASLLSINHVKVRKEAGYNIHAAKGQYYLSYELYLLGRLRESEERIRDSIMIFERENHYFWHVLCLQMLYSILIKRGAQQEALLVRNQEQLISSNLVNNNPDDMIDVIAHITNQTELLNSIAAEVNDIEEELLELNAQAENCLSEQRYTEARNILTEVFLKEDYRLIQADAWLILARIEQCEDNIEEAIFAASNAYRKAWCDGSIYVYQQALQEARNILDQYDRAYPDVN